jgi:uncharacterized protein YukE
VTVPVPPVIPGDPAGMRSLAQLLRGEARQTSGAQANVDGATGSAIFEGPAGDRFRSRMRAVTGALDGVVAGLGDVAGQLERAADDVEASQRAHDAAVQENEREAQLQVR